MMPNHTRREFPTLVENLNAQTDCSFFGIYQTWSDWVALFDPSL